jgi:ElaB/YqjD/DUF883 family membrane-anchored ribosome-binding protein
MTSNNDTANRSNDSDDRAMHDVVDTMGAAAGDIASEARAAAEDLRDAGAEIADAASHAASQGSQHARAAANAAKVAMSDAAELAAQAAADAMESVRERIRGWRGLGEDYVRTKPIEAVGLAAAAGIALGIWFARRRK